MAQIYATDVLGTIDERFYLDSVTKEVINNGVEMEFSNGNNAVTIYTVNVVAENDYVRNGIMRYGQLLEIGTGTQTFVLSQDKSFAISVDRGNREDSKMVPAIDAAVKRQIREVSVPTTDIYRLSVAAAYAVANSQSATAALSSSNAFAKILDQRAALQEAKVQLDNIVVYVTPTTEAYLWLDTTFKSACDRRTADVARGVIGTVMGMTIITVPTSYFIANLGFMMLAKDVLVAPTKFNEIKTGDGFPFGISGMVAFGRRYYDCFIPANKGVGIRVHKIA
jgi:hypothetical protein